MLVYIKLSIISINLFYYVSLTENKIGNNKNCLKFPRKKKTLRNKNK